MALKYIGNGAALVAEQVPARDLTDDEVAKFDKTLLLKSGLYKEVKQAKAPAMDGE